MAKTRAKMQGKLNHDAKNPRKTKKKGHVRDLLQWKKIKMYYNSMEFSEDEGDIHALRTAKLDEEDLFRPPLSPRSPLHQIKPQEEIQADFDFFLSTNRRCATSIAQGNSNTPLVLRSGSVVRNLENSFKNSEQDTKAKVKITMEDIKDEVEFRRHSIVCYVLEPSSFISDRGLYSKGLEGRS
uniref:Uncharacterized protein n=1 Tax=Cannabis sativa TaxID=3483 RepID=A0A803QK10_CANSA